MCVYHLTVMFLDYNYVYLYMLRFKFQNTQRLCGLRSFTCGWLWLREMSCTQCFTFVPSHNMLIKLSTSLERCKYKKRQDQNIAEQMIAIFYFNVFLCQFQSDYNQFNLSVFFTFTGFV